MLRICHSNICGSILLQVLLQRCDTSSTQSNSIHIRQEINLFCSLLLLLLLLPSTLLLLPLPFTLLLLLLLLLRLGTMLCKGCWEAHACQCNRQLG